MGYLDSYTKLLSVLMITIIFLTPIITPQPRSTDYQNHLSWTNQSPDGKYLTILHKIINFIPINNEIILLTLAILLRLSFRILVLNILVKSFGLNKGSIIATIYLTFPYIVFLLSKFKYIFWLYTFFPDFQFHLVYTLPSFITLNIISWSFIYTRLSKSVPFLLFLGRSSILLSLFYFFMQGKKKLFLLALVIGLVLFQHSLYNFLTVNNVFSNFLSSRAFSYPLTILLIKMVTRKKRLYSSVSD